MTKVARGMGLGLTAAAVAVIIVTAFLWAGPGAEAITGSAAASVLFDEQTAIDIYEGVSPAVVEVNVGRGSGRSLRSLGSGSGFLVDNEGHIVTNNHVVEAGGNIQVKFSSGATAEATIVGRNPANDLALLKVDASVVANVQPVDLGDSDALKPGQMAIAIGNPFGLEGSVTVGVISQIQRSFSSDLGRPISNVIQTDANINPGNSGGPLLNSSGEVVGINTAMQVSPTGQGIGGIGFAVPINTLKDVLPRLKSEAIVRPPWLGVQAGDIDSSTAERLGLPVDRGVYVIGVAPGSPAEDAGLVESGFDSQRRASDGGDIITEVDGVAVGSTAELITQLNAHEPGDPVTLTVIRGDATLQIEATLGQWPESNEVRIERRFERGPSPDVPDFRRDPFRRFSPPGGGDDEGFPRDFFEQFFPSPRDNSNDYQDQHGKGQCQR